jgi:hypothetical protein
VTKLWTLRYAVRFSVGTGDSAVVRKVHGLSGSRPATCTVGSHRILSPVVKQSGLKFTDCMPPSHNVTNEWSSASTSLRLTGLYVIHIADITVPYSSYHYCRVWVAPVTVVTDIVCLVVMANCVPCCDGEFILKSVIYKFGNAALFGKTLFKSTLLVSSAVQKTLEMLRCAKCLQSPR